MESQVNQKTKPFQVKGVHLMPNGHMLAGFAIGAIRLATTATFQLRSVLSALNWSIAVVAKRMAPMT